MAGLLGQDFCRLATWNDLVTVEDLERLGYPGLEGCGWDSSVPEDLIPTSGITTHAAHAAAAESGVALTDFVVDHPNLMSRCRLACLIVNGRARRAAVSVVPKGLRC